MAINQNVSIVFAGVNGYYPGMTKGHTNITGVAETQDMAGTLNLVLTINPGIKTVLAVVLAVLSYSIVRIKRSNAQVRESEKNSGIWLGICLLHTIKSS